MTQGGSRTRHSSASSDSLPSVGKCQGSLKTQSKGTRQEAITSHSAHPSPRRRLWEDLLEILNEGRHCRHKEEGGKARGTGWRTGRQQTAVTRE